MESNERIFSKFLLIIYQHIYDELRGNHYNRSIRNVKIFIIKNIIIKSSRKNVQRIRNQQCEKSLNLIQADIIEPIKTT